ncbi:probable G-protein coupled receptor 160 isoform X7 [Equus asinus]|uniref:probable G-protein coupled receptor 160 isoform X7 n=1 Tax=Equus asinus TaxID=9793 RepID=UPI0038F60C6C
MEPGGLGWENTHTETLAPCFQGRQLLNIVKRAVIDMGVCNLHSPPWHTQVASVGGWGPARRIRTARTRRRRNVGRGGSARAAPPPCGSAWGKRGVAQAAGKTRKIGVAKDTSLKQEHGGRKLAGPFSDQAVTSR